MAEYFDNNPIPVVEYSDKTNLLEQSAYRYQLQDRPTPNLYRHLFDYDSVPKISFNHRSVPMHMPSAAMMYPIRPLHCSVFIRIPPQILCNDE